MYKPHYELRKVCGGKTDTYYLVIGFCLENKQPVMKAVRCLSAGMDFTNEAHRRCFVYFDELTMIYLLRHIDKQYSADELLQLLTTK